MDLSTVGFLVGVLALILAVPLAVLANLLTPRVQAWYSTTSLNRVNKRLMQLTIRLRLSEESWTFTPAEWELYSEGTRRIRTTLIGIIGLFYFIAFGLDAVDDIRRFLGGPIVKLRFLPLHDSIAVHGLLLCAMMCSVLSTILFTGANARWRHNFSLHTDVGRQALRAEIERLTNIKSRYES
jgi:hypothetical protein